ncbi:MAG TPA: hypothetical protein VI957_02530 [Candidatus Paceibacterota bacterium]
MNVITCKDPEIEIFLDDVGGLSMGDVAFSDKAGLLAPVIPVIPRGMFSLPSSTVPYEVVGITINDTLTKRVKLKCGYYHVPEGSTVDPTILKAPILEGKRVILFSTGQDVLIETLWWERHDTYLFDVLAGMGFYAITGMNFSLFEGECPFAHALNIQKCLRYSEEIDRRGIWSIPHVYARNLYQRERWKNLLNENKGVGLVTINSQLQRSRVGDMSVVFDTARFLLEHTRVTIMFQGSVRGMPQDLRLHIGTRIYAATSAPCKKAVIRKDKSAAEYIADYSRTFFGMSAKTPST